MAPRPDLIDVTVTGQFQVVRYDRCKSWSQCNFARVICALSATTRCVRSQVDKVQCRSVAATIVRDAKFCAGHVTFEMSNFNFEFGFCVQSEKKNQGTIKNAGGRKTG
nr:PREDICTED: uncharacterized protein LOC107398822 [Tribolium castaneum]|eukprot:XP_015839726.1 PREDICTED: uncharacterized protein LOC107398822 [Tribolium castaneum]